MKIKLDGLQVLKIHPCKVCSGRFDDSRIRTDREMDEHDWSLLRFLKKKTHFNSDSKILNEFVDFAKKIHIDSYIGSNICLQYCGTHHLMISMYRSSCSTNNIM